jgi:predicted transcriptional regulator
MNRGAEVITEAERAKVLIDPMRREMLRLLADKPKTEKQIAEELGLTNPAVGHHLKILKKSRLIRIAKKEVEQHGITQKFYQSSALSYFVSDPAMPLEVERYFTPERLERTRGIIAAVSALTDKQITITTKQLEQFATILTSAVHHAAHTYSKPQRAEREEIITKIYRDAFVRVLRKPDLLDGEVRNLLSKK